MNNDYFLGESNGAADFESSEDYYLLEDDIDENVDGQNDTFDHVTSKYIDNFWTNLYRYFYGKGFRNIILTEIAELGLFSFLVGFMVFLFNCVDYSMLFSAKDPAIVYHVSSFIDMNHFWHMSFYWIMVIILFSLYTFWKCLKIYGDYHTFRKIGKFYSEQLQISDFELATLSWKTVRQKVEQLQNIDAFYMGNDTMSAHNVANRIMRKENFMIALITQRVINVKIRDISFFTKSLEWNLNYIILNFMFDKHHKIKDFVMETSIDELGAQLKKRFIIMGVLNILLSPFMFLFVSLYVLFHYGQEFYKNPSAVGGRQWSLLAKWKFREFNELPHVFYERMRLSEQYAAQYLQQFPTKMISELAKLVGFISSTFLLVLLFLAFLNEHILFNVEFGSGKSVFWVMSIMGTITIACRNLRKNSFIYFPGRKLQKVHQCVHYIPKRWVDDASNYETQRKFCKLYQLSIWCIFKEIVSTLINGPLLLFMLSNKSLRIINFIKQHTTEHPTLGRLCEFANWEVGAGQGNENGFAEQGAQGIDSEHIKKMFEQVHQNKLEKSIQNFYQENGDLLTSQQLIPDIENAFGPIEQNTTTILDIVAKNKL